MSKNINIKNREAYENAVERCREKGITIPTIAMQKNPELIPEDIKSKLQAIDITAIDPLNLYRITWKNDPETGLFNDGNIVEFPSELTGVDARIIGIVGKWFPTGSHKVGAAFGCLVPELVTGGFDPITQKAVWPSTGNYCRGG
ncbi:pyridoxal-5-phosphate-dependent protein subunit beta, partial [bacterium]|nr:pyridoxal-5-phosphate-dependent protein subunit beta [bacterium]